jgi:DNA-binding MarR family transcriptional regulator
MNEIKLVELFTEINRKLFKRLAPLAHNEGLSTGEFIVLWKMHRKVSCRVLELAGEIGVPPSTLTGILDRLTAGGWLEREADPEDRRAVVMKITPKLRQLIRHITLASGKSLVKVFKQLPPELIERLAADLTAVFNCLEREETKE